MNKVILLARLVKDPSYHHTSNDKKLCRIRVAEGDDRAVFINVLAVGRLADQCNTWLKKGSQVLLEGKLKQEEYKEQTYHYIFADQIKFLHNLKEKNV